MKKSNSIFQLKPNSVLIHLILWLLFIQIIFDVGGLYYSFQELIFNESEIDDAFLHIPFLILFFYLNSQWLIPRFLKKKSWWQYLILLILIYSVVVFVSFLIFIGIEHQGYVFRIDRFEFLDFSLMMQLLVLLASLSRGITKIAFQNLQKEQLARQKQQEAELKFLATQFNPHFLFNSLNSVYSLAASEDAPQTTEAILKLSEIIRYPIKKGENKTVLLTEEIQFVEDYIDFQRFRLGADYPIQFDQKGNFQDVEIMPLSFISLVENAFKYGVSQRYKTPIDLKIELEENIIVFSVKNQIVKQQNTTSFQVGIENLKARLDIIYGEKYSIEIDVSDNKIYHVELRILQK